MSPYLPPPPLAAAAPPDATAAGGGWAGGGFVLAHLSDPHVPTRVLTWPSRLLGKRALGYLSWHLHRSAIHRQEVLAALAADLQQLRPDHMVITGDIVNISLPAEFRRAGLWLRTLGEPTDVTVVPGNHDAYVNVSWERSWAAWQAFMLSDGDALPAAPKPPAQPSLPERRGRRRRTDHARRREAFPIVRRRGPVAVIGLSTAIPTAPGRSSGTLGPAQLERLHHQLTRAGDAGLFRVVLLHHPPHAQDAPRHARLLDAERFTAVLADVGAELVLHGHEHRFRLHELSSAVGQIPVFGVPSASMLPHRPGERAGQYHLHRITPHTAGWTLETRIRTFDPAHARFLESQHLHRLIERPAASTCAAPRSATPA